MLRVRCCNCHRSFKDDAQLRRHLGQKPQCYNHFQRAMKDLPHLARVQTQRRHLRRPSTGPTRTPVTVVRHQRGSETTAGQQAPSPYTPESRRRATHPNAGKPLGRQPTVYEARYQTLSVAALPPYTLFNSREEWEMADWIIGNGIT
ncbi:hypothetical protein OH77DRAFT_194047 [Trametes cingulata]|nr:hypothetical protein OH77DRAFT_194047 [Trametes cingulata]